MVVRALRSLLLHLILPWTGVAFVLGLLLMPMSTGFGGFFVVVGFWLFAWFWFFMGIAMRNASVVAAGDRDDAGSTTGVSS